MGRFLRLICCLFSDIFYQIQTETKNRETKRIGAFLTSWRKGETHSRWWWDVNWFLWETFNAEKRRCCKSWRRTVTRRYVRVDACMYLCMYDLMWPSRLTHAHKAPVLYVCEYQTSLIISERSRVRDVCVRCSLSFHAHFRHILFPRVGFHAFTVILSNAIGFFLTLFYCTINEIVFARMIASGFIGPSWNIYILQLQWFKWLIDPENWGFFFWFLIFFFNSGLLFVFVWTPSVRVALIKLDKFHYLWLTDWLTPPH